MKEDKQHVMIGKFGRPHGIKGSISVYSYTEPETNIENYCPWLIKDQQGWHPIEIQSSQWHGKKLVVQVKGCTDRNQAELLTNCKIATTKDMLPELASGEFYWQDLVGLAVYNEKERLGVIERIFDTGANDVLVVKNENKQEILIPYLWQKTILEVDVARKKMIVDWDEQDN